MFRVKKTLFLKKKHKTFGFVMRTYYLCANKNKSAPPKVLIKLISKYCLTS